MSKLEELVRKSEEKRAATRAGGANSSGSATEDALRQSVTATVSPWFEDNDTSDEELVTGTRVQLSSQVKTWRTGWTDTGFDPLITINSPSVTKNVPALAEDYILNQECGAFLAYHFESGSISPALLTGPAGVGKTSMAKYIAAIMQRPFFSVSCSGAGSTYSSLIGKTDLRNGDTAWSNGIIPTALSTPNAILCMDEVSHMQPEVANALLEVLNENGQLTMGEAFGTDVDPVVKPAAGVSIVFTDNTVGQGDLSGEFIGAEQQNSALLDRIGMVVSVGYMRPAQEVEMLKSMGLPGKEKLYTTIVNCATRIREASAIGSFSVPFSPRTSRAFARHACGLSSVTKAFELVYANRLPSDTEKEAAMEILKAVTV